MLKARLQRHGVTYGQVARLARVSWRMVKYVIDGERTSATVMAAIERLTPDDRKATAALKRALGSAR